MTKSPPSSPAVRDASPDLAQDALRDDEYRVNLRVPAEWRASIQRIRAERRQRTGLMLKESEVWRLVLEAGFEILEEKAQRKRAAAPPLAKRLAEMRETTDIDLDDNDEPTAVRKPAPPMGERPNRARHSGGPSRQ